MDIKQSEIRPTSSFENQCEGTLEAGSVTSSNIMTTKSEQEIDEKFKKIKERLKLEKTDGSRTNLK